MLQQTQVERVLPFYAAFIKKFPTARALAAAPLSEILKSWQGLGYNRRANMLLKAAKEIAAHGMPHTVHELEKLPGIGPYTARALAAFAYNHDVVVVETNIRTAVLHHFFPRRERVSDGEIERILRKVLPTGRAREWYGALMDYGAHLKRSGISRNAQSRHYAKQTKFAGSAREARGAILRELTRRSATSERLMGLFGPLRRAQAARALAALAAEGLIRARGNRYALAD